MAIHPARVVLRDQIQEVSARAISLAELPGRTIVAVFEDKRAASGAAVQILTTDADALVWLCSGREAADAIRAARAQRSLLSRLLRGFGDEELVVREILQHADNGRTVLVVKGQGVMDLRAFEGAAHIYRFGQWTFGAIRQASGSA